MERKFESRQLTPSCLLRYMTFSLSLLLFLSTAVLSHSLALSHKSQSRVLVLCMCVLSLFPFIAGGEIEKWKLWFEKVNFDFPRRWWRAKREGGFKSFNLIQLWMMIDYWMFTLVDDDEGLFIIAYDNLLCKKKNIKSHVGIITSKIWLSSRVKDPCKKSLADPFYVRTHKKILSLSLCWFLRSLKL